MDSSFFKVNRGELYKSLDVGTIVVLFSGKELRKTADSTIPFTQTGILCI